MDFTAIVIGAGQAGLATSYHLQQRGVDHVVLERGRVGETWRSQRWDSFAVNTPNWSNGLPGDAYDGPSAGGFYLRDELVSSFERYREKFDLPVRTGVTVTAVDPGDGGSFAVTTSEGVLTAEHVVVAAGTMNVPRQPAMSDRVPSSIAQFNTATYRNPDQLPEGAVLVVGGGQSGGQVVEELLAAGRRTYLATSRVGHLVRRYRGRDILEWWRDMGFLDVAVEDLEDPAMQFATQPLISGTNNGHSVTLPSLARAGAVLLGRAREIEGGALLLDDDLGENIAFGQAYSDRIKSSVDEYIASSGVEAVPADPDPAEEPIDVDALEAPSRLDLADAGISAIIWCTGFGPDFSWLHVPCFRDDGRPAHDRGISTVPGVYFVGFPWLHSRKSGVIWGVDEDGGHIASHIAANAAAPEGRPVAPATDRP